MKMRGKRKTFGRCRVEGHGQNCHVSEDIQSKPVTRSFEKLEERKEIEDQLKTETNET